MAKKCDNCSYCGENKDDWRGSCSMCGAETCTECSCGAGMAHHDCENEED